MGPKGLSPSPFPHLGQQRHASEGERGIKRTDFRVIGSNPGNYFPPQTCFVIHKMGMMGTGLLRQGNVSIT